MKKPGIFMRPCIQLNTHKGFVLFTTLFFLQIFSLLGALSLMNAIFQLKGTHLEWKREKNWWRCSQVMNQIELDMMKNLPSCQIPLLPDNQFSDMPRIWWQAHACRINKYHYVIEKLELDPCSLPLVTIYRVTLRCSSLLLQSTMAMPSNARTNCSEAIHEVQTGEQMRRQLVSSEINS